MNKTIPKNILRGHESQETAYIIPDYPYGFRYRTKKRMWIETTNRGQRVVSQTLNPKTDKWNKPKCSTYSPICFLFSDDKGYIQNEGISYYDTEETLKEYAGIVGEDTLSDYEKKVINSIIAYLRGQKHVKWRVVTPGEGGNVQSEKEKQEIVNKVTAYEFHKMKQEGELL